MRKACLIFCQKKSAASNQDFRSAIARHGFKEKDLKCLPYTLEASALEKSLKDFVQETGCGELFVAASRGLPQKFLKDVLPAALQQLKADRLDLDFHYLPPR